MSPRYGVPVTELILGRLPNTLFLVISGLSLAIVAGVGLGAVMASWAGRLPDRVLSVLNLLLYSTPGFWIGLMLILLIKDFFPRRVMLEPINAAALAGIILVVCILASGLGIRAALRVDPATAIGG